jgi:2-phosphoglycerate kinase
MIYILGGAARSGKTLLSRRAVAERGVPYFPLDAVWGGLAGGAPQLGITWDQAFIERAERMWPITKPVLSFFFHEDADFLIEGDTILPKHVRELMDEGNAVRCCFLGYTELTSEEKLALVRTYEQGTRDWTNVISDEEMTRYVEEMIVFSTYLKSECERYGIPYFDISHDFDTPREEAFGYLFE